MTMNGVMAVTLRYFTEFGKPALQKTMCGGIYARVHCIFSACIQCRRKESSRSLSHLLISFLFYYCIPLQQLKIGEQGSGLGEKAIAPPPALT